METDVRGRMQALILAVLADGPRHGYAVIEALRERSDGALDLPTGTVYPVLRRLEAAGQIEGTWSTVGGRRRRTYRLLAAGKRALAAERADWRHLTVTVDRFLGEAP